MTVPDKMKEKKPFYHLPRSVIPHNYDLHLKPNQEKLEFVGEQKVYVDVLEATNTVVLNAAELDITFVTYKDGLGNEIKSQSIKLQPENETVTITFQDILPVGKLGYLVMAFSGKIGQATRMGVFVSRNTRPGSTQKHNIFTQFEPTHARLCIPCWDEPAFKATFDVSLTVPKHLTALSNMPARTPKPIDETTHVVSFERSPIMSTYLLAFAIGEFDYVEDYTSDGILVRVYTGKGLRETGRFALDVATKVLSYYKDYFDIPYPLPKMDLIAVEEYGSGAMENWGLVVFRDTCLLYDSKVSSAEQKQTIAYLTAHEIAHMWFGNLVTMAWFTHLWLNEGYATFAGYLSLDSLYPEFNVWSTFLTKSYLQALELDSLKNTHAIEVPIGHPSEIKENFDAISYSKGSSILRMLHSYIGDDDFRKGMHAYLEKFSFANAQTEDLWLSLGEASGKPVRKVMSNWTEQKGFPLVKIEEIDYPNSNSGKRIFKLTQNQFTADGSPDREGKLWHIPMKIICGVDPKKIIYDEIFNEREKIIELEDVPQDTWIKINPGLIGFFRTMYSKELFDKLSQAILTKSLDTADRVGIFDDLQALSRSGAVKVDQVLRLMLVLNEEKDYTVWLSIISSLNSIGRLILHLEIYKDFQAFVIHLLRDVYEQLGWDAKPGEGHLNAMLRSLIIEKLIAMEDPIVLSEAKKRFDAHTFSPDLSATVYRAVISQGDENIFNTIMNMYREAQNTEKDKLLSSLGYSKDPEKIKELLRYSISDEARANDAVFVMSSVTHSYQGSLKGWNFFKENLHTYVKRCSAVFVLPAIVNSVIGIFVTEAKAKEVEEFFQANPVPIIERSIKQSLEKISVNEACLKANIDNITNFLKNEEMAWNRNKASKLQEKCYLKNFAKHEVVR